MTYSGRCFLLSWVITGTIFGAGRAKPISAEKVGALLKAHCTSHPRLFLPDDQGTLKKMVNGTPLLAKCFDKLAGDCELLLKEPPLKRVVVGRRLLGTSRRCLQRVSSLAFAYRVLGKKAFLKRAEQEMLAAAAFKDWNPSHFLDVAEMTTALGIGYDWLYNDLTPASRTTIRKAIVDKGLTPKLKRSINSTNNWNQVCNGGAIVGALAVAEDHWDLATTIISQSAGYVRTAMREYEPDGAYPEGATYWVYGTSYNVLLVDALQSVLGTDLGLLKHEGFMKSPHYVLHMTGPTGRYYNYADCGLNLSVSPALFWFARQLGDAGLLWYQKPLLERVVADARSRASGSFGRFAPFLFLWSPGGMTLPEPGELTWSGRGANPVAVFRTGWDDRAIFVGIKAGSPSVNHAHMDVGGFIMAAQGVRWGIELGAQGYHDLESKGIGLWNSRQDGDRWRVFRLNNFSHSVLTVNNQLQRVKGRADITKTFERAGFRGALINTSQVYKGQLKQARRGMAIVDGASVVVQDEVVPEENGTTIRWAMLTAADVTLSGGQAILKQGNARLLMKVLSPAKAALAIYQTDPPPAPHDCRNKGTRLVGFTTTADKDQPVRFTVLLVPGGKLEKLPDIKPLSAWGD